jgi:hypothetical protein
MNVYAGLDVSLKETAVCIVDQEGTILLERKVLSEPKDLRTGISNARPVQGCPPPVARNRPYVASKLRGRVACLGYLGRQ